MPQLEAHPKGRHVLLMFEKYIGPAIAFACDNNDTMHMTKTVEMIRCQLVTKNTTFSGSMVPEDIDDSIPPTLLQLVKMIEHDIKSQLDIISTKSDLGLAQLLMFDYPPNTKNVQVQQRHSADRETPFCVYLGLLVIFVAKKTGKDTLLIHYFNMGYGPITFARFHLIK
ncbi:unnamed protein product [Mytilus coruscus]|uniref:Uncharacterized protein n=1 Tax=Mytilus coruscus TaxID=42192 RepID=A0A6J8ECV7_MYTCO|nr:unnamed protein product [Mytilus coruscus]